MIQEIRNFYFPSTNGQITNDTTINYNNLMSDAWFTYGIDQAVKLQVNRTTGNVYYYLLSLETKLNVFKNAFGMYPLFEFPGASHGDDLAYVFMLE